jgi:predicted transcriptional regulator
VELKSRRRRLKISQTRLATVAGVSRFKIALFELGEGKLTPDEQQHIETALRNEAKRIQQDALEIERTQFDAGVPA